MFSSSFSGKYNDSLSSVCVFADDEDASFIVTVYDLVAVAPLASSTFILNVYVPALVGLPEILPVVLPIFKPDGKVPLALVHVYGAVPPEALLRYRYSI